MASTSKLPDSASTVITPTSSTSSNPFTLLTNLDPSKKYTLVFLFSVGTTLLITGFSGGKLLKKAKTVTATPLSSPITATSIPSTSTSTILQTKLKPLKFRPTSTSNSLLNPLPPPPPSNYSPPIGITSRRKPKSFLRQWTSPSSPSSSSNTAQEFFLPNSLLLSQSNAFASALDKEDQLHKDGSIALTYEEAEALRIQQEKDGIIFIDDGFNPAVFAAKAFGIATVLTVGSFGIVLAGVMSWFGVSDLESLSLALSHSLPPILATHRPSLPNWALPNEGIVSPGGIEEDNLEHKEGVAYWVEVKEILDREAEELKRDRRRKWESLQLEGGKKV